jgi:hypothetical protein
MLRRVLRAAQRGGGGGHGHGHAHGPARLFGEPVSPHELLPARRPCTATLAPARGFHSSCSAAAALTPRILVLSRFFDVVQALPPGQSRASESWELSYGVAFAGAGLIAVLSMGSPNTDPHDWARDEAEERMRR